MERGNLVGWLFVTIFLLGIPEVSGQPISLQECQTETNGVIEYNACLAGTYLLLLVDRFNFNLTVTPPEATCGQNAPSDFCLYYVVSAACRCNTYCFQ